MNDTLQRVVNIGDCIMVIDAKSKRIVCAGKVLSTKDCYLRDGVYHNDVYAVSIDLKYFFNISSKNIIIREFCESDFFREVDERAIRRLVTEPWNEGDKKGIDVFIENTKDEVDPEVKNLVDALNTIDGIITTGSCSGHKKDVLWVSFGARTIKSLIFLSRLIQSKFNDSFVLSTKRNRTQVSDEALEIAVISTSIGKRAYIAANQLADSIIQIKDEQ